MTAIDDKKDKERRNFRRRESIMPGSQGILYSNSNKGRSFVQSLQASHPEHVKGSRGKSAHKLVDNKFKSAAFCGYCGGIIPPGSTQLQCSECRICCHNSHCSKHIFNSCGGFIAVKAKFKFSDYSVLPMESYSQLIDLLAADNFLLPALLGKVSQERENAAAATLKIFESKGRVLEFINAVVLHELDQVESTGTLFRANSMASKAVETYMKQVASDYLKKILGDSIREIVKKKPTCEVDPCKLEKGEDLKKNFKNLMEYATKIMTAIFSSASWFPIPLRQIFSKMQQEVVARFPDDADARYICIAGYIFLRFFAPAVLGPKLFGFIDENLDDRTARTFTLLAKIIQTLANLVEFGQKEPFMEPCNTFIKAHREEMKMYIDTIANLENIPSDPRTTQLGGIDLAKECAKLSGILSRALPKLHENRAEKDRELIDRLSAILDEQNNMLSAAAPSKTLGREYSGPGVHVEAAQESNDNHTNIDNDSDKPGRNHPTPSQGQQAIVRRSLPDLQIAVENVFHEQMPNGGSPNSNGKQASLLASPLSGQEKALASSAHADHSQVHIRAHVHTDAKLTSHPVQSPVSSAPPEPTAVKPVKQSQTREDKAAALISEPFNSLPLPLTKADNPYLSGSKSLRVGHHAPRVSAMAEAKRLQSRRPSAPDESDADTAASQSFDKNTRPTPASTAMPPVPGFPSRQSTGSALFNRRRSSENGISDIAGQLLPANEGVLTLSSATESPTIYHPVPSSRQVNPDRLDAPPHPPHSRNSQSTSPRNTTIVSKPSPVNPAAIDIAGVFSGNSDEILSIGTAADIPCSKCNLSTAGQPSIECNGKVWHAEHFCCSVCALRLDPDTGRFWHGIIFCSTHFAEAVSRKAITCETCNLPISFGLLVQAFQGKTFHAQCFCCFGKLESRWSQMAFSFGLTHFTRFRVFYPAKNRPASRNRT